jgi:hypothetical protein
MSLEETHEEGDIEATDENDDPGPPTPHAPRRNPVGRMSGDVKAIVGVEKRKYPHKSCSVCAANKKYKDTRCICRTFKIPQHKGDCFTRYHIRMKYY